MVLRADRRQALSVLTAWNVWCKVCLPFCLCGFALSSLQKTNRALLKFECTVQLCLEISRLLVLLASTLPTQRKLALLTQTLGLLFEDDLVSCTDSSTNICQPSVCRPGRLSAASPRTAQHCGKAGSERRPSRRGRRGLQSAGHSVGWCAWARHELSCTTLLLTVGIAAFACMARGCHLDMTMRLCAKSPHPATAITPLALKTLMNTTR